jgi:hypothetical protein
MPKLPGSPAYGLATADPPAERSRSWAAFRLAALGTVRAYPARLGLSNTIRIRAKSTSSGSGAGTRG